MGSFVTINLIYEFFIFTRFEIITPRNSKKTIGSFVQHVDVIFLWDHFGANDRNGGYSNKHHHHIWIIKYYYRRRPQ